MRFALLRLALASLNNRRFVALLTVLAIALSSALLLGVERLRSETRNSFAATVSGTDLIVGARSGSLNLLLYSVFRIGQPTSNIRWESYRQLAEHPQVKWAVPLSLGDSHRGFPVLGTSTGYFEHFRYGRRQALELSAGRAFAHDPFEVVLGAEVARRLGYRLDDELVLAHGTARVSLIRHDDQPFRVVGILAPTGTPVDRTLHISLEGMQALHLDWQHGAPGARRPGAEALRELASCSEPGCREALQPRELTAILVGLHSRVASFALQREINQSRNEPLLAILPGVALQELWSLMGLAEKALLLVGALVVVTGLIGMLTALLAGLNERRREMAILRSLGARPWQLAALLVLEAGLLSLAGLLLGLGLFQLAVLFGEAPLQAATGLGLGGGWPRSQELALLGTILAAGLLIGLLPAWRTYRQSLADGLSIRL